MTPGRILLGLRQRFGHGLAVAYFRDIVRPKILQASPLRGLSDDAAEIHVLTSADDWLNLIWTLRSFYAVSPIRLPLCIHGDSSLPPDGAKELRRQFPEARIVTETESRAAVLDGLAGYPNCRRLRETNTLSIKIFDFRHHLATDRIALFDSDLLFYAPPTAWLKRLRSDAPLVNCFNADVSSTYALAPDVLAAHGAPVHPNVNSGFGIVHRESLQLDWLEEFLSIPGLIDGHFWRIEQTLFALCSSRYGVELLPEAYRVYLEPGLGDRPFRHYVGAIRHLMYGEGMRRLARPLLNKTGADCSGAMHG